MLNGLIRITEFEHPSYSTGYSSVDPFGHIIQKDEDREIFHCTDNYEIQNSDVTGHQDLKAVLFDKESDETKALVENEVITCEVEEFIRFISERPIYVFGRYWEDIDKYSLEFRGIIAESICGGWKSEHTRTAYLFDTALGVSIENGIFQFNGEVSNIPCLNVLGPQSIPSKFLVPDTQTEVLEIDLTEKQFEKAKTLCDSLLRIS